MIHALWLIPLRVAALYAALRLYDRGYTRIDVRPAAYPWPRGIDDAEIDGIVDDVLGRLTLDPGEYRVLTGTSSALEDLRATP